MARARFGQYRDCQGAACEDRLRIGGCRLRIDQNRDCEATGPKRDLGTERRLGLMTRAWPDVCNETGAIGCPDQSLGRPGLDAYVQLTAYFGGALCHRRQVNGFARQ